MKEPDRKRSGSFLYISSVKLERLNEEVAPLPNFIVRLGQYALFSLSLILLSIGIGITGYRHYSELNWVDSFHMSSMILTGMGPVAEQGGQGGAERLGFAQGVVVALYLAADGGMPAMQRRPWRGSGDCWRCSRRFGRPIRHARWFRRGSASSCRRR